MFLHSIISTSEVASLNHVFREVNQLVDLLANDKLRKEAKSFYISSIFTVIPSFLLSAFLLFDIFGFS